MHKLVGNGVSMGHLVCKSVGIIHHLQTTSLKWTANSIDHSWTAKKSHIFMNCKKTCMLSTAKNMCSVDCKLNLINRLQKTLQSRLQKLTFWSTAKINLLVDCKKNIYSSTAKCNFAVRSLCSRWISIILQSINKFWPLISRICSRWHSCPNRWYRF